MRRAFALLVVVAVVGASVVAGNSVNTETVEMTPIPRPVEYAADMDKPVPFDSSTVVTVDCPDMDAVRWLDAHFAAWYGPNAPSVKAGVAAFAVPEGEEAYTLIADASGVRIAARTLAGVRYAAYTIRQLAIAKRGTLKTAGRLLPTLKVTDRPALKFRAVHLCWFPDTQKIQIERAIRLAALLKFNYAIIEPWGTFKSETNPWFGWPDAPLTKAEIARLVALGRDLGITLVPQLNAFGHASSSRACTLQHATLDLDPDYEPLFEPGGWNWCLTNPEAQKKLREIVVELHDAFGRPPFFHLGCDEAQPPTCPACRKVPYGDLVCRHVAGLAEFVASRGARAMIWHDMLLKSGDPRWKGFTACGTDETVKLADLLPKDVVVCDWEYGERDTDLDRWPTAEHLLGKGLTVATSPFLNWKNCGKQAEYIAKHGGFGYVQTTWNCLRGNNWVATFRCGSCAAWGTPDVGSPPQYDSHFANALRLVGHDMKVADRENTGLVNHQTPASWTEGH